MRLHRLTITAIGPFAGTETIDMDALAASGLFLLEGPTGAGKSTVLDAITFALYGQAASSESSADRLRSHFADADATPEVVLELSVRGDRLRITRVPEHDRPKKRGEGTTKEKARVHLERFADGAWSSVSSHVQEVAHILEDVVGLNREQFTKVVLLPQGEFATFLRADDDVRRKLLTKVFGTGLYDKVTDELDRLRREAGRERDDAELAVSTAVAKAVEAAGLDGEEADALGVLPQVERQERLAGLAAHLAEQQELAAAARSTADDALALVRQQAADAEDLVARHARLGEAHAALHRHLDTEPAHTAHEAELAAARAAVPAALLLDQLDAAESAAADALADLVDVHPAATDDERAGLGADRHDAAAREADDLAAGLGHLVDRELALVAAELSAASQRTEARAAEAARAALALQLDELPERIAEAEAAVTAARSLAVGAAAAEQLLATACARLEAAQQLVALLPRVARARNALDEATSESLRLQQAHLTLLRRHLDGIAAELAQRLVVGEACFVCGGVDHPAPATPGADAVSADDVAHAESVAHDGQAAEDKARTELDALLVDKAQLEARADGADVEQLAAEVQQLTAALAAARTAEAELPTLVGAASELARSRDDLATRCAEAGERAARLAAEAESAEAAVGRDRDEVAEARAGHPSVAARQADLRAQAQSHRSIAGAIASLAVARAARETAAAAAEAEALAAGFASVAEAAAARRSPAQIAALAAAVQEWAEQLVRLRAALSDDSLAGLDPDDAEAAGEHLAVARAELDHLAGLHRQATALAELAAARSSRFADRRAEVEAAEARRAEVVAATQAVYRLAGLAKGTSGQLRMSLTTYVLRRWFEQVVEAANVRLASMSAGRYELERTDDAERRTERSGLALKVIDRHTGEARSPRSLSGGETFYTSLALALGLADVVKAEAGGVDLDTLFIDEGFGTLDPDTLEQVMSVIDDLRDGGRAVGIVSHVGDLKDRITERLEVRRPQPQGPSRTQVVA